MIARRDFMKVSAAAALSASSAGTLLAAPSARPMTRRIPSSGEEIPCVGLGSWITFNVGNDPVLLDECAGVIKAFADGGGRMIDSSPMYGSSQSTIGHGLAKLDDASTIFSADKVWTSDTGGGRGQVEASR